MNRITSIATKWTLLVVATSSWGQNLVITSFQGNGSLSWTNSLPNAEYRVEWASQLANGATVWTSSWDSLTKITSTATSVTSAVPMFYRVVGTQPRTFHFPDYLPPDPNVAGSKGYRQIVLPSGTNYFSTASLGFVGVPYTSGTLWGVRIGDPAGDPDNGWYVYNDGTKVQWLGFDGWYLSADTNLTGPPLSMQYSAVYDGLTNEVTYVAINSTTTNVPYTFRELVKVETVKVPMGTFTNAIVFWAFDTNKPFTSLEFFGHDVRLGISLPTEAEAGGDAVTEFDIYARGVGKIAAGDVEATPGILTTITELISISHD